MGIKKVNKHIIHFFKMPSMIVSMG